MDAVWLYRDEKEGSSSGLLKYRPKAAVPNHFHHGHEVVIVLEGSFKDERGTWKKGDLVVNPKGSTHSIYSEEGCINLLIYQKPVEFTKSGK